ncbi:response regulator, partial [bacterium]
AEVLITYATSYGGLRMPERSLEHSLRVAREFSDVLPIERQPALYSNIASALIELKRFEEADRFVRSGLEILGVRPDSRSRASLLANRVTILSRTASDDSEVVQLAEEAIALLGGDARHYIAVDLLLELGTSYEEQGRVDEALRYAEWALKAAAEIGLGHIMLATRKLLARIYERAGDFARSGAELREIVALLEGSLAESVQTEVRVALARQEAEFAMRDVERMREEKRQAEEANRAKTDFLASMSHEIRTPLNGILGVAAILGETQLDARQREYLNLIRISGDSLVGVIGSVLDISKIEAGKLDLERREFDFAAMCDDVAFGLALRIQEKGVGLVVSCPFDFPPCLVGDEGRLRQILLNLVGNAAKFTEKGEIAIVVSLVSSLERGVRVRVEVVDTGIGIAEDRQKAVFESYSQADDSTFRRFGGTGLGLTISKRLVVAMGGRIGLRSELGVGSTFWFEIDMERGEEKTPDVPRETVAGRTVALVGQTGRIGAYLEDFLIGLGLEVTTAETVEDVASRSDLVIMDHSSEAAGGIEALRTREERPHLPVILLDVPGNLKEHEGVVIPYTWTKLKPIRRRRLTKILAEIFAGRRPEDLTLRHEESPFRPMSVLVAEDNPINQLVIRHLLTGLTDRLDLVEDGAAAVAAAAANDYDLILMDCLMPVIDGYEATRQIRRQESDKGVRTPIVAITANSTEDDRAACLAAGMDDFVTKPITKRSIEESLQRALQRGRTESASWRD